MTANPERMRHSRMYSLWLAAPAQARQPRRPLSVRRLLELLGRRLLRR